MRNTFAVLLASGMLAASAGAGLAECSWGMASKEHNMTVAKYKAPLVEEQAVTTFDPQVLWEFEGVKVPAPSEYKN